MLELNFVSASAYLSPRWRAKKVDVLFAISIFLQGVPVWAAVQIINVNGPPELFKVQHGTSVLPAESFSALEKDDEVFVLKPEPITQKHIDNAYGSKVFLTLKLDNGEIKKLGPGEQFTVPSSSPSAWDGLPSWFTILWGRHDKKERNVAKGSLESTMPLPLLGTDSDPAKLVAGKNSLHLILAKKDQSQPSYWVHVYEDDAPLTPKGFVVEQPEIVFPSKEVGLPSLSLSSVGKKYKVVAIGRDGSVKQGVFKIEKDLATSVLLVHKELEKLNAIKADKSRNDEEKETLIATLLAQNGLLLEAYQKVASSSPESGIPFFLKSFLIDEQLRERVWREQVMKMEEEMMKMKGKPDK